VDGLPRPQVCATGLHGAGAGNQFAQGVAVKTTFGNAVINGVIHAAYHVQHHNGGCGTLLVENECAKAWEKILHHFVKQDARGVGQGKLHDQVVDNEVDTTLLPRGISQSCGCFGKRICGV